MKRNDGLATITSLAHLYISTHHRLAPATKNTLLAITRIFERDNGPMAISLMSGKILHAWKQEVLSRAKPVTWRTYLRHICLLLRFARERDMIETNPCDDASLTCAKDHPKPKILSTRQIRKVLEYLKGRSDGWFWRNLILFLYYTGVRRRQLAGITPDHIDLKRKTIVLEADFSKNRRPNEIPVADPLVPVLRAHLARIESRHRDLPIFDLAHIGRPSHRPLEVRITECLTDIARATGVPISPHKLRHTFASTIANNPDVHKTGGIKALAEILGHSSPEVTMKFYVHTDMRQKRRVLRKLKDL